MKIFRSHAVRVIRIFLALFCLMTGALSLNAAQEPQASGGVYVLNATGAIGPALYNYLQKGFSEAADNKAALIVVELNTPGGLLTSTREITTLILNSAVPVAMYVTPSGGHAASAGTFLVYASHVAAMTEGTNIGAATPIQLGSQPDQKTDDKDKTNSDALDQKAVHDTTAFIRGLADLSKRNGDWAQKAVTDAESLTAKEALEKDVIDVIATSRDDLIAKSNGRTVRMGDGTMKKIVIGTAPVTEYKQDFKTKLLIAVTDPNIAMILMSLGMLGLTLEFYHPGTFIGGVSGLICLLLGFYAMNILPINMTGLFLVLIGFAMLVAEIYVPSFGVLGIGGTIAFVLGASMMFEGESMPGLALDMGLVYGLAAFMFLMMMGLGLLVARAMKKTASTGIEGMIGHQAEVIEWAGQQGYVKIQGELWQAANEGSVYLQPGDHVLVTASDDLMLKVRKI